MPDVTPPTFWTPEHSLEQAEDAGPSWPVPPLTTAMLRGARGLCPACGMTHAFRGYLKVVPECDACGAPLGAFRADDAPPYFTIFIVGHVLIPIMYWVETGFRPELWLLAAVFLPLSLVMTLGLLRPVKGATLGLMLKLGMVKSGET